MKQTISLSKVMRAVRKKIPLLSDKKLQRRLDFAGCTLVQAYHQGVFEAQMEIACRIDELANNQRPEGEVKG